MSFTKNKSLLKSILPSLKKKGILNFIDGKWIEASSKKQFDNYSPVDDKLICKVAQGSKKDIDKAAKAASKAFQKWKNWPHKKRKTVLYKLAEEIEKNADKIAVLESYDTGQPISFMQFAAKRAAENFRYFADKIIDVHNGESLPDKDHINFTTRQAIGPVGIITPWNVPFTLASWKIAPALAAGCTVVHKPAELSPITSQLLGQLTQKAGIPDGVWNIVNGYGEEAGKALCEHEDIKAIAFVGGADTGKIVMRQGASTLKRMHFELGGKNPVIVFDDADLNRALDAVVYMKFSLNGERCTSSSRLIIHENIYESFVKRLKARIAKLIVGHPLDPKTEIGPMINKAHQQSILAFANEAKREGAKILTGGYVPEKLKRGAFLSPTLIDEVNPKMRIAQEEVFGPLLTVLKFKTEAQAIKIANSVKFGLTAYIWTNDGARSHRVARDLDSGMIWINSQKVSHLPTPYGGFKNSGIGRDGGNYSFDLFLETKNIAVAYGNHEIPKLGK